MSENAEVVRGKLGPILVHVEAGKTYLWCSCGRSKTQPLCDGAHRGTQFEPVRYVSETARTVFFCACKETCVKPLCDGTHTKLGGYSNGRA